jgi:hypothetical protein
LRVRVPQQPDSGGGHCRKDLLLSVRYFSATSVCASSLMRLKIARMSCSVIPGAGALARSCFAKARDAYFEKLIEIAADEQRNRRRSSRGTPWSCASANTRG